MLNTSNCLVDQCPDPQSRGGWVRFLVRAGPIWDQFWVDLKSILGRLRIDLGSILGRLGIALELILDLLTLFNKFLSSLGSKEAIIVPQPRPDISYLREIGFDKLNT